MMKLSAIELKNQDIFEENVENIVLFKVNSTSSEDLEFNVYRYLR